MHGVTMKIKNKEDLVSESGKVQLHFACIDKGVG